MAVTPRWRRYLRLLGIDVPSDVDDELRFHLEARRQNLLHHGVPPETVEAETARRFGDVAQVRRICIGIERERVRKMHWKDTLAGWRQDMVYSARQLRRSPGFTLTAMLSLALGIGANTAIFTLSDQIVLRLLPVERPRELVQLRVDGGHVGSQNGDGIHTFSLPTYLALRDNNSVFSGVTGEALESAGLMVDGRSDLLNIDMVAGNYFEVFGVKPYAGRLLAPDDDRVKLGAPVAVLRYEFWQSRFNGNPATVGSTIRLNGYPFTVIGIAPPGFEGTDVGYPDNIWIPVTMKPALNPNDQPIEDERYAWFYLFARLKPGVTMAQAEAAMKITYKRRQEVEVDMPFFTTHPEYRQRFLKQTFSLEPASRGQSSLREHFERPLVILQWLVGAVLLIACCNIAGLLLARGAARQREMAIRGALGAGRGRLVRQLLAESILLVCLSGVAGILLSGWVTRMLIRLVAADPSRLSLSASPDVRILAFAFAMTVVTTLLVGLLPAWQSSRPAAAALKEFAGSITGSQSHARVRKTFVAFQVALSTLLLTGAGLFAHTLGNLRNIDLGFRSDHLATMTVLPAMEYDDARKLRVFRNLVEALAATPGVKAVGGTTSRLFTGGHSDGGIRLPGIDPNRGEGTNSFFHAITPGYMDALGIRIKAGRDLSWRDWDSDRKLCLVNEAFVDDYLPGRNPVGMMLGRGSDAPLEYEIIGVTGNARYHDPRGRIPRQTYFALNNRIHFASAITVYARTQGEPRALLPQLREQVRRVDSNLLITNDRTADDQLNMLLANERMLALLSESFAFLALLLAVTGLYGVLSYTVARRNREIGIRMALGARRSRVIRLVLSEMTGVILSGAAAGVLAAILSGRYVKTQLYGVKPVDSIVLLTSIAILAAASLLAVAVPAWRASRLDPTLALRQE